MSNVLQHLCQLADASRVINPNLTPLFFALWVIDALISYDHAECLYALWLIFDADCFNFLYYKKWIDSHQNRPS